MTVEDSLDVFFISINLDLEIGPLDISINFVIEIRASLTISNCFKIEKHLAHA